MTMFNDIQEAWNQQGRSASNRQEPAELIRLAKKNTKAIKAKHWWTIGLLSVTVLLLAWYFITYAGNAFSNFTLGLLLMIFALLLRVVVEYISFRKFNRIDIRSSFTSYQQQITAFYSMRKRIHYVITPVIFISYVAGFILLLPVFQQVFSKGFYWYLVSSGTIFLIVIAWVIIKQNKKEMQLLSSLQESIKKE
jgi:hypothetical protein